ncbi:MAG: CCA tRNA nucleotidyltransferase [Candidatus Micrarchaeota archaeon]
MHKPIRMRKAVRTDERAERVLARVLSKIKPTHAEEKKDEEFSRKLIAKLRAVVPPGVEIEMAGSIAKKTNLRGDRDFDVFILFPKEYTKKDLVTLGLGYAKKAMHPHHWEIGYAEHPYLRAKVEGCDVDVVPSFKIYRAGEMLSSVDRSPLHTEYVLKNMGERQRDEVRLLKQFLKRIGAYGAELKTAGFSGYLCELLILRYGSFRELLAAASAEWGEFILIDFKGEHVPEEAKEKFHTNFVVVDPVDENRNVAAVVSRASISKFILAARAFLEHPSEEYFFISLAHAHKKEIQKRILGRGTEIFYIRFNAPRVVPDILWPQMKKTALSLVKHLEMAGFRVFGWDVWSDDEKECLILIEMETARLPAVRKAQGPPVHFKNDVYDFLKKHGRSLDIWIEDERVLSIEKRKFTHAGEIIRDVARSPKNYGIPDNIAPHFKRYKLLGEREALSEKYLPLMRQYFVKKGFYLE